MIYSLVIVLATGSQIAPGQFDTMKECQAVADRMNVPAYCIKVQPVDIEKQMAKMLTIMKTFQSEMEKQ
jgi:hypothetical protein